MKDTVPECVARKGKKLYEICTPALFSLNKLKKENST